VSDLRHLIKSVTEDGVRQVRNIFEVNSLDFIIHHWFSSRSNIVKLRNTPIHNSNKILPDSWKITWAALNKQKS
jgi:hypothetical protein